MKTAVAVVFLLCAVAISEAQNHASWGIVGPNDFRAHYEIVKKSSSFAQVVTKDASFPQNGTNFRTITAIRCTDQITNNKGGYASLLRGGVGFNQVTVHFKSQRNNGFNFIYEVWVR